MKREYHDAISRPIDPEVLAKMVASVKQVGLAVAEAVQPLGDAITVVYGPRVAATMERQAAEASDRCQRVKLRREAAQVRGAASLAWHRLEQRKREADRDRSEASGGD